MRRNPVDYNISDCCQYTEDTVKDSSDTESRVALIWLIAFAGIAAAAAVGVVAVKKRKEEK